MNNSDSSSSSSGDDNGSSGNCSKAVSQWIEPKLSSDDVYSSQCLAKENDNENKKIR
jgi:hypothetical protein